MSKYFFTNQISKKFKSVDDLPEWLSAYPHFQDQIKLMRETLGMTQEQLGNKVNRSLRSIQQIESGQAMPKITTLHKLANALNAELTIAIIPRQNIVDFIDKKALIKAKELVKLSKTSSALEIQSPSEEESNEQIEILKKEILEKKRNILWNQILIKK